MKVVVDVAEAARRDGKGCLQAFASWGHEASYSHVYGPTGCGLPYGDFAKLSATAIEEMARLQRPARAPRAPSCPILPRWGGQAVQTQAAINQAAEEEHQELCSSVPSFWVQLLSTWL